MKKFIIVLGLVAGLIGCDNFEQNCFYIYKIEKSGSNKLCRYEIYGPKRIQNFYIVDTIGRWNVGDTILISSQLQKENRAEK